MQRLYLLRLRGMPIFQQLQIEEALLRCDERNWCIINEGSPDAIVMGISGKADLLVNQELMQQKPVPLIRRFSGGGTVFVDKDTHFITWIGNCQDFEVPCCPQKIGHWTEHFYQKAFPQTKWELKENDYVIGDKKFGGNAQYLRKQRWLHHSSLLWNFDPQKMNYLLLPNRMPAYREQRQHADFLCKLSSIFHSYQEFNHQMIAALHDTFDIKEKSLECALKIKEFSHRQATQLL